VVTEKAILSLRGDLTVSHADGRTEIIPERKAPSGGRAYWGVSHELLIRDFYARLGDDEPF
jgi:UDP-N-acetyl-2-amino-2-deoxyglucuronate dehydrogenase